MTTIIVSPIALDAASNTLPTMPGKAAGIITFLIVSERVAPNARDPSRIDCGTALMTSSDRDDTKGIIITPITIPAANALSEATLRPIDSPTFLIKGGYCQCRKKNHKQRVGIPAKTSKVGFAIVRNFPVAYSLR